MNRIRARSARLSVTFFVTIVILASCRSKTPQHIPMGTAIPDNVILQNLTATQNVNSTSYVIPQSTTSAAPPQMVLQSMGAQTGSGQFGNTMSFISGTNDPNLSNSSGHYFEFGAQLAPGGADPGGNYYQFMTLHSTGAGVVLGLCGGTDDDGAGCAGTEISADSQLSLATEKNSPILISPSNGSGNGQSTFAYTQTSVGNLPMLQLSNNSGSVNPAVSGYIGFPWGNSSSAQEIFDQRNSGNTGDLSIISRQTGVLTYGSFGESNVIDALSTCNVQIQSTAGNGLKVTSPSATAADFTADVNDTWVQGDVVPVAHDSWVAQIYSSDTAATSLSTLATIPIAGTSLPSGSQVVTSLRGTLVARERSTGDFATFDLPHWSYVNNAGTITAPSGSEPAATDTGHSTGAGTSIAPQFSISGSNILLKGTPWTTSALHWTARIEQTIDSNNPVTPSTPEVIWGAALVLDDDSRFVTNTGATLNSLLDQSGSGNNATIVTGSIAYSASGGVNGLPKLTFASGSIASNTNAVAFGSARTFFAVVQASGTGGSIIRNGRTAPDFKCLWGTGGGSGKCDVASDEATVVLGIPIGEFDTSLHLLVWEWGGPPNNVVFLLDGVAQSVDSGTLDAEAGAAGYQIGKGSVGQYTGDWYRTGAVNRLVTSPEVASLHAYSQSLYGTP